MAEKQFTPVTITKALAVSLPVRHGYTTLVYRLSAPVSRAWLAQFADAWLASAGAWPYERPIAFIDRIQVLLPDRDHADGAALAAIKAYLEAALASANRSYRRLPAEEVASGAREIAWERRVLATLQSALDEQYAG